MTSGRPAGAVPRELRPGIDGRCGSSGHDWPSDPGRQPGDRASSPVRNDSAPQPEIFHRGTADIDITEGLSTRYTSDGQLAAVLCQSWARWWPSVKLAERPRAGAGTTSRRPTSHHQ